MIALREFAQLNLTPGRNYPQCAPKPTAAQVADF
jgi:hypothetical protein